MLVAVGVNIDDGVSLTNLTLAAWAINGANLPKAFEGGLHEWERRVSLLSKIVASNPKPKGDGRLSC